MEVRCSDRRSLLVTRTAIGHDHFSVDCGSREVARSLERLAELRQGAAPRQRIPEVAVALRGEKQNGDRLVRTPRSTSASSAGRSPGSGSATRLRPRPATARDPTAPLRPPPRTRPCGPSSHSSQPPARRPGSLYKVARELQQLLAVWTGAGPTCHRNTPEPIPTCPSPRSRWTASSVVWCGTKGHQRGGLPCEPPSLTLCQRRQWNRVSS